MRIAMPVSAAQEALGCVSQWAHANSASGVHESRTRKSYTRVVHESRTRESYTSAVHECCTRVSYIYMQHTCDSRTVLHWLPSASVSALATAALAALCGDASR